MIYELLLESTAYHRVLVEADSEKDIEDCLWKIGDDLDRNKVIPINVYKIRGSLAFDDIKQIKERHPVTYNELVTYKIEDEGIFKSARRKKK